MGLVEWIGRWQIKKQIRKIKSQRTFQHDGTARSVDDSFVSITILKWLDVALYNTMPIARSIQSKMAIKILVDLIYYIQVNQKFLRDFSFSENGQSSTSVVDFQKTVSETKIDQKDPNFALNRKWVLLAKVAGKDTQTICSLIWLFDVLSHIKKAKNGQI